MRVPYILSYMAGASNPPFYLTLTIAFDPPGVFFGKTNPGRIIAPRKMFSFAGSRDVPSHSWGWALRYSVRPGTNFVFLPRPPSLKM